MAIWNYTSPALDGAEVDLGSSRQRQLYIPNAAPYSSWTLPFWVKFDNGSIARVDSLPYRHVDVFQSYRLHSFDPTPTPPSGDLVTFSDANLEMVLGPLPTLTDGLTPSIAMPCPNYDFELMAAANVVASSWTRKYPRTTLTGTVNVTLGSGAVVGNGTLFTQELDNNSVYGIVDGTGTQRRGYRVTIQDDTHLTISPTWAFADAVDRSHASDFGTLNIGENNANDGPRNYLMGYGNYYDFVSLCYMLYLRSNDGYWLTAFRDLGHVWWNTWYYGGTANISTISAPRNSAMLSMILRARDQDSQGITHTMWDYLYHLLYRDTAGNITANTYFGTWLWLRKDYVPGVKGFGLYYGARDPGYALWYTLAFALLAPDTWLDTDGVTVRDGATIKADMLNNAMIVMRDYICRAQYSDGSWRWSDSSGALDWGYFNQPFILGIFMECVILAHRACETLPAWHAAGTNWDGTMSLLEDIEATILKFANWLFGAAYCHYYPTNSTLIRWRSCSYAQFVDVAYYRYPNGTISIDPASPRTIVGSSTTFTETPEVNPTRVSKQPAIKPGAYIGAEVIQQGTVSCAGTTVITGVGTNFLSNPHLHPGKVIRVGSSATGGLNDWRVVSIDSDTQLTLSQAAGNFSGWVWALDFGTWLSGYVNTNGSSSQLLGTGTHFLTELTPGQSFYAVQDVIGLYGDQSRRFRQLTVLSIQSDTELTLTGTGLFTQNFTPICLTMGAALTVASVDSATQITTEQDYTGPAISDAICRLFCTYPAAWNGDPSQWSDNRQNNTEWIHVYGYAYHLTGDTKYLTWGDEALDACFARLGPGIYGSTGDSRYGWQKGFIGWYWGWRSKELNQAHRSTGRYLGWRAGA